MSQIEHTSLQSARKHFIGSLLILALAIIYMVSPFDFLPEAIFGPLGYLEDIPLLLTTAVYAGFRYMKMKKTSEMT